MHQANQAFYFMAKRKKSKTKRRQAVRRRVAVALWCLAVAIAGYWLVEVAGAGGNAHAKHRLDNARQLRDALEVVKMPDGVSNRRLAYHGFWVYFNAHHHIPNCTVYELTRHEVDGRLSRAGSFETDSTVEGCARPWDYTLSGYERGHMVPARDLLWSREALHHSFKMTNVCPQAKSLNEGGWAKLEEKVREWCRRDSALIVVTGPILSAHMKTIGKQHIAVPRHFFKIVLAPYGKVAKAIAFIYPNGACNRSLSHYAVSIDSIEKLTGMDFFDALPNELEHNLESNVNLDLWTH